MCVGGEIACHPEKLINDLIIKLEYNVTPMSRAMICTMAFNGRVRLVFFKLRLDRLLVVMTMVPSRISAWLVLLPRERMRSRVMCSVCVCMYVCMYVYIYVDKKRTVWGLTTGKSPVSVIYCSLVEFNGQKRGLLCQAIRSGKEIWNHSINGT